MNKLLQNRRGILWLGLALLAALMIAGGVLSGEAAVVYRKASMICMECIGIG